MRRFCIFLAGLFWLSAGSAVAQDPEDIPLDTPLEEIVCQPRSNVDTCWSLGLKLKETNPVRAAAIMVLSCELEWQIAGCYEAGKLYLLNSQVVNYDRARLMFETACYGEKGVGVGPYACKYLGHMVQLGLGQPQDVFEAHQILIRACFSHNDLTTDGEGCGLLAQSYLFGFDRPGRGQSANAIALAFISYARGCIDRVGALCRDGEALLQAHGSNVRFAEFLEECDAGLAALEDEERTCMDVFERPLFRPAGYTGTRGYAFSVQFKQFWRGWFARLEPEAAL